MTNSNFLLRWLVAQTPFAQVTYILTSPFTSLEQFLRAVWKAVSWAIVLSNLPE